MKKSIKKLAFILGITVAMMLSAVSISFAASSSTPPPPPKPDYSAYLVCCSTNGTYYNSLQTAIDSCGNGTYLLQHDITESVSVSGKNITINLNNKTWNGTTVCISSNLSTVNISGGSMKAGTGGDKGGQTYGGVLCAQSSTITLNSVTLKNGSSNVKNGSLIAADDAYINLTGTTSNDSFTNDYSRGAYYLVNGSTLVINGNASISNITMKDNVIHADGSSIVLDSSDTTGKGAHINDCKSTNAVIYVGNLSSFEMKGTSYISNCDSSADATVWLCNAKSLTMSGKSYIVNCDADWGAIYCSQGSDTQISLKDNAYIKSCTDKRYAGAISSNSNSKINISDKAYIDSCSGVYGGAIYSRVGSINLSGSNTSGTIRNCTASDSAGAIYSEGASVTLSGQTAIVNSRCTVWGTDVIFIKNANLKMEGDSQIKTASSVADTGNHAVKAFSGEITLAGKAKITASSGYKGRAIYIEKQTLSMTDSASISGFSSSYSEIELNAANLKMAANAVILSCSSNDSIVSTADNTACSVSMEGSSKIQNCTSGPWAVVYINDKSSLTVSGNSGFDTCKSSGKSGAVENYGNLTISGNAFFKNCEGKNAGAIWTKKTISLAGSSKTACVSIEGCKGSEGPGAINADGLDLTLTNVVIKSCKNNSSGNGGAVLCKNLTMAGSSGISSSSASGKGGGVYASGSVGIYGNSYIQSCSAGGEGGGVYAGSSVALSDNAQILNCTSSKDGGAVYANSGTLGGKSVISGSKASKGNGGGVYIKNSLSMSDTACIMGCSAVNGGAVYVPQGATLTMSGLKSTDASGNVSLGAYLMNNKASGNGGAVCSYGTVKLTQYSYINSAASDSNINALNGGAVAVMGGSFEMTEFSFIQNCHATNGGALYINKNASASMKGDAQILNCNVSAKSGDGGGVYNEGSFSMNGNTVQIEDDEIPSGCAIYSCAANRGGCIYNLGTIEIAAGNIASGTAGLGGAGIYAAGGSNAKLNGNAILSDGTPNLVYAEANGKLAISSGSVQGKFRHVNKSDIVITGGWFWKPAYITDYVGAGYNVSDRISNSPYKTAAAFTVFPDSEKVTLSFCANLPEGGVQTLTCLKGYNYTVPACTSTKQYFEVLNWNTIADGTGTALPVNGTVFADVDRSYYADWTVVAGSPRKLILTDPSGTNKQVVLTGNSPKFYLDNNYFSRSMYNLLGFNSKQDGSGIAAKTYDTVVIGSRTLDLELYAQWQSVVSALNTSGTTCKIIYIDPTNNNISQTFQTNTGKLKIVETNFKLNGKTLDCWNTMPDGSGKSYGIGEEFTFTGNGQTVNLYAIWMNQSDVSSKSQRYGEYSGGNGGSTINFEEESPSEGKPEYNFDGKYTVTYVDPSGENSNAVMNLSSTTGLVLRTTFSRINYSLSGWSTSSDGSTVKYRVGDLIDVTANPTLYAVWTENKIRVPDKQQEEEKKQSDPSYDPTEKYEKTDKSKNKDNKNDPGSGGGGSSGGGGGSFIEEKEKEKYYYDPAQWAKDNGIFTEDVFNAQKNCPRGEMLLYLWRSQGSPTPSISQNPFTDIKPTDDYYYAVLWAYENGITKGTSKDKFSPMVTCTRAHGLTFLYRTLHEPYVDRSLISKFKDVKSGQYYVDAVAWAIENDVTNGTSKTTFSPDKTCNRADIITFMYRALAAPSELWNNQ